VIKTNGRHAFAVKLSGEYDLTRRDELAAAFDSIGGDVATLVLEVGDVTFVDSSFLNELARLRQRLTGCEITLVGANAQLRRIFAIVAFERIFRFEDQEPATRQS
jgi:anti-anti-sigma factor